MRIARSRRRAGLLVPFVLAATLVAGCVPESLDQPPFKLADAGTLTQSAVIENASWPTASFGSGELIFQRFAGSSPSLFRYAVADASETELLFGYRPSACSAGIYFFDGDSLAFLAPATTKPVQLGLEGYDYVQASPGNRLLLLARERTEAEGGGFGELFIADPVEGIVQPFSVAGTYEPQNPSWDGDTSLLADALSAEGSDGPRNAYRIVAGAQGAQGELVKLGVTNPVIAGSLLACLEQDAGDGKGQPALAIYDTQSRERLAVTEPGEGAAFGRFVWLSESALAVESVTSDGATAIRLYTLAR